MNVRIKILGIIGLVFLTTTAVTWFATVSIVQAEYIKIEADNVKKDTARAVDALGARVDQLALKIPDWASWDDTYKYALDHNANYIEENLQNFALQNLDINFMLFFDAKQQLIIAKGVDMITGEDIPLPPELTKALAPGSTFLATSDQDQTRGLLRTEGDPIILVTRPILRADSSGPPRGTIAFGQYVQADDVAKIGEVTHLKVAYDSAITSTGSLVPAAAGTSASVARTETNNATTITGYQLIDDIYGQPMLIARVQEPRSIYLETQRTLAFYLLVVLSVTLVALLVAIYTTRQIMRQDQTIKLKNEFFSVASHELRTPLTAILGNSSMIKTYADKKQPQIIELADDIHAAAARLVKIVTNFLDAARLERGQMPLKLEAMSLAAPVKAVVDEIQSLAKQKGLYVRDELPADLPRVMADPDRLQQVIYNLVGNAMKFTQSGGITISGSVKSGQVEIIVSDTGRGISAADQQKLFKSFQQTRSGDEAVGSGLGLYISKQLVEHMGGRISLQSSTQGEGTVIAFSLPIVRG